MTTYTVIQHQEVGAGGAASITFSDIPQTYTDLYLVVSARSDRSGSNNDLLEIRFNGSDTNRTDRILYGNGSSAGSFSGTNNYSMWMDATGSTANTFGNAAVYIPNYTSTTTYKSYSGDSVIENNATDVVLNIVAGLWSSNSAVTSLTIVSDAGYNLVAGSSATLYGIRKYNTSLAPKATGGIISFDSVNNKWVHVFTASGTFTPTENLTNVEYLVVAGGGGGSWFRGGGGGAGGYRSSVSGESSGGGASAESALSLTSGTGYTVTIGAGGTGSANGVNGTNGSSSVFSTITSTGGGVGGYPNATGSGGSGGGATAVAQSSANVPGSGTTGQGYAGGSLIANNDAGSGGGGAGAVGGGGVSNLGGNGGIGVQSSITGTATYRAGGGGGGVAVAGTAGTGGNGGGGNGATLSAYPTAGTAGTGGGGGGAGGTVGANGGSGIVIVRYAA